MAEMGDSKPPLLRRPSPCLWMGTLLVLTYVVWCLLLVILTASGHLLNRQDLGCINEQKDFVESRLIHEAMMVYIWAALSLLVSVLLLLEFWRRKGYYIKMLAATGLLCLFMAVTFSWVVKNEAKGIHEFEQRQMEVTLSETLTHTVGSVEKNLTGTDYVVRNVFRWQAEFKCCGLQGYQDWGSSIPDSCLCDEEDAGIGCVGVGRIFVYEKPCLPTVLAIVKKRSFTFWTVMIVWISITGAPIGIFTLFLTTYCCYGFYHIWRQNVVYKLNKWLYKMRGREEMVPVVFMRKTNNNHTKENKGKDGEVKESSGDDSEVVDIESGTNVKRERRKGRKGSVLDFLYVDDNPVFMIPLPEFRRLEEALDTPPVQHQIRCLCTDTCKRRNFYIILLDGGSTLLPSEAVLVDPDKSTHLCLWAEGHHVFNIRHVVWPDKIPPGAVSH